MATTKLVVAIVSLLLFASSLSSAASVSPAPVTADAPAPVLDAPAPALDACFTALTNMSDCLTYVEDGSKLTKPDKGCCPELAGLIDSNPICLCQLLGNSDSIGIKINLNKALKLPSLCKVTTPPVSTCSAIGVPVSLPPSLSASLPPSSSGDSISPGSSAGSPSNTAGASEGVLSPSKSKSGASSIQVSVLTFIFAMSTLSSSIFF